MPLFINMNNANYNFKKWIKSIFDSYLTTKHGLVINNLAIKSRQIFVFIIRTDNGGTLLIIIINQISNGDETNNDDLNH